MKSTFKQRVASAKSYAQQFELIAYGGAGPTAIEQIIFEAAMLRKPSAHGPEWQAKAEASVKARFAEALFPALRDGNKKAFKQVIEIMGAATRLGGNILQYALEQNKINGAMLRRARRLYQVLIMIPIESRMSLNAAREFLDATMPENGIDDSRLWNLLNEVNRPILKAGQRVQCFKGGKLVRELRVKADGKFTERIVKQPL